MSSISPNVNPEISQVLAQMRVMQAKAQSGAINPTEATNNNSVSFGDVLARSIDSVNQAQQTTNTLRTGFEKGDPNVTLTDVMIASQKSSLAFSAMVEVRNKFLEAYKTVMNMPV